eukprot:1473183-Rhodomonas_salina.1
MAERVNWLGVSVSEDVFGQRLAEAGISEEMLREWLRDPQVALPEGERGSLFDQVEDMDVEECLARCKAIAEAQA